VSAAAAITNGTTDDINFEIRMIKVYGKVKRIIVTIRSGTAAGSGATGYKESKSCA
jgi:hypothetical protein